MLLLLLLCTPAGVQVLYLEGGLRVFVCFGPLRFCLYPRKPKKRKPKKAKAKKQQPAKPEAEPEKEDKPSLGERLGDVRALLRASKKPLRTLTRHIVIDKLSLRLRLSGEDAHATALLYGKVAAILTVTLEILGELFILKKPDVALTPDWSAGRSTASLTVRVRIRPIYAIIAALQLLAAYLKRPGKQRKIGRKGGKQHEPTASHR